MRSIRSSAFCKLTDCKVGVRPPGKLAAGSLSCLNSWRKRGRSLRRALGERNDLLVHRQPIVDAEGSEHAIGSRAGNVLVHLALH